MLVIHSETVDERKLLVKETPSVSVIIPAYNVDKYIAETITSVVAQTRSDWELIIVDDGSTDNTLDEIRRRTADIAQPVRVLHQDNSGLSAARNRGLEEAHGTYVYFLDSDDRISSNALAELTAIADSNDLDMVMFSSNVFADSPDALGDIQSTNQRIRDYQSYCDRHVDGVVIMSGQQALCSMVSHNRFVPSVPFSFYRRSFIRDETFIRGILFEDNPFTIQALLKARKVGITNARYYDRRIRGDSIMQKDAFDYVPRFISRFIIAESIRSHLRETVYAADTYSALERLYADFITLTLEDYDNIVMHRDQPSLARYQERLDHESRAILRAFYLNRQHDSQPNYQQTLHEREAELTAVKESTSYRIGLAVTAAPRLIKRLFRGRK